MLSVKIGSGDRRTSAIRRAAVGMAACICSLANVASAANDVVLRWQDRFLSLTAQKNAFLVESGLTVQADCPPMVSREMAVLNTSIFNAVNAFGGTYQMYGEGPGISPSAGASREAAAIEAARISMRSLFPSTTRYPTRAAQIDGLADGMLDELLDNGVSSSAIDAGRIVGAAAANKIVALRAGDDVGNAATWADSNEFGKYRTDTFGAETNVPASMPQWGTQQPWTMTSSSQFRRNSIPNFTSPEYTAAIELTRTKGSKARYDAPNLDAQTSWEQRTAMFWAQKGLSPTGTKVSTGTTTPVGQWLKVARDMAAEGDGDLLANSRLMALLSIAVADAGIAAWDMKYAPANSLWRPIHAIRFAAQPGDPNYNPGITRDENWMPLIPTSNHPEFVSGHSTFSAAAATVLTDYFGDDVLFTIAGDDALWIDAAGNIVAPNTPGASKETRTYTNFWDAAEEAGISRIYGGIHYMFSNQNGLAAGSDVGNWVLANSLQVVPEPSTAMIVAGGLCFVRRRRV